MKKAEMHIAALEFTCPKCEEYISHPSSGSHLFMAEDVAEFLYCDNCELKLRVPAKALKYGMAILEHQNRRLKHG